MKRTIKGGGSLSSLVQLSTSINFSPVPRLLPPHAIILRGFLTRLSFCVREASSFWGPGGKFPHNCLLVCTAIIILTIHTHRSAGAV